MGGKLQHSSESILRCYILRSSQYKKLIIRLGMNILWRLKHILLKTQKASNNAPVTPVKTEMFDWPEQVQMQSVPERVQAGPALDGPHGTAHGRATLQVPLLSQGLSAQDDVVRPLAHPYQHTLELPVLSQSLALGRPTPAAQGDLQPATRRAHTGAAGRRYLSVLGAVFATVFDITHMSGVHTQREIGLVYWSKKSTTRHLEQCLWIMAAGGAVPSQHLRLVTVEVRGQTAAVDDVLQAVTVLSGGHVWREGDASDAEGRLAWPCPVDRNSGGGGSGDGGGGGSGGGGGGGGGTCRLLLLLPLDDVAEQFYVFDSQPQDFVLAELLLGRVGGHQLAQFREGTADVLLSPALATVAEGLAREHDQRTSADWTLCCRCTTTIITLGLSLLLKKVRESKRPSSLVIIVC